MRLLGVVGVVVGRLLLVALLAGRGVVAIGASGGFTRHATHDVGLCCGGLGSVWVRLVCKSVD